MNCVCGTQAREVFVGIASTGKTSWYCPNCKEDVDYLRANQKIEKDLESCFAVWSSLQSHSLDGLLINSPQINAVPLQAYMLTPGVNTIYGPPHGSPTPATKPCSCGCGGWV